jgi:biopolymer transport protein TolQ
VEAERPSKNPSTPVATRFARARRDTPAAVNNFAGFTIVWPNQTRQLLRNHTMLAPLLASPVLATNIIEVFERCDAVDKVIVVGLAVFSLVAWTIMFGKHFELKRLRLLNNGFESQLRDHRTLLDLPESFRNKRVIPYADLFADAVESYWRAAAIGKERGEENTRARLEHAENALQRALARQTLRYESSMIFLASIVSGAPFIGLLGTVWGVMEAFSSIAVQQTAGIQQLAPGVSGAMLATIAGLIVAIPSVFGYNLLLGNTRRMITELENFASSLADRLELESHVGSRSMEGNIVNLR